jgi:hypothetical protein
MSASTPLFQATIEPDEDPSGFPSGNIGSNGRPRAEPVVLTPVPDNNGSNGNLNGRGEGYGDAETGIVSSE